MVRMLTRRHLESTLEHRDAVWSNTRQACEATGGQHTGMAHKYKQVKNKAQRHWRSWSPVRQTKRFKPTATRNRIRASRPLMKQKQLVRETIPAGWTTWTYPRYSQLCQNHDSKYVKKNTKIDKVMTTIDKVFQYTRYTVNWLPKSSKYSQGWCQQAIPEDNASWWCGTTALNSGKIHHITATWSGWFTSSTTKTTPTTTSTKNLHPATAKAGIKLRMATWYS